MTTATRFLWVNKGPESLKLSSSTRAEEQLIRRHAQTNKQISAHIADRSANGRNGEPSWHGPDLVSLDQSGIDTLAFPSRQRGSHVVDDRGMPYGTGDYISTVHGLVPRSPSTFPHLSGKEQRSFDFFRHRTAMEWSGWEDAYFWTSLAPQLAQSQPAITHCLIALAALHEQRETIVPTDSSRHDETLARFAEMQSLSAITAARERASTISTVEALVSCLTLICLQNLQHSHHSFRLLQSGLALLNDCDIAGRPADGEQYVVYTILRPLFDRLVGRLAMLSDPARALQISIHAERQAFYRGRSESSSFVECELLLMTIPRIFHNVQDARDCLCKALQQAQGMLASPLRSIDATRASLRLLLQRWTLAADALLDSTAPAALRRQIYLLKVGRLFASVLIETLEQQHDEMIWDKHIPKFDAMLNLITLAAHDQSPSQRTTFGVDAGVLDIFSCIGAHCRDPVLRRRAWRLLMQEGRREGGRLANTAAKVLAMFVRLEEAMESDSAGVFVNDLDLSGPSAISCAAQIPATNRVKLLEGAQFLSQGLLRLRFARCVNNDGVQSHKAGSEVIERWVSLSGQMQAVDPAAAPDLEDATIFQASLLPETIIRDGCVAFRDAFASEGYSTIGGGRFHFPIPRG